MKHKSETLYIIITGNNEVYTGLQCGKPTWSLDWSKAKPLPLNNIKYIVENQTYELLEDS